jgi:hypothetical protein
MLTCPIVIRYDSELIRESICACAKLFDDEENVGCAIIDLFLLISSRISDFKCHSD